MSGREAGILIGNYGDNITHGVKSSLPGFDVRVTAGDNDVTKRSFNSQWPNLCKLKIIGAASSEWTQYQLETYDQQNIGGILYFWAVRQSGWQQVTPVQVPTGLSYIPIWEERVFDTVGGYFYDDYVNITSSANAQNSYSGARSYHSGPATAPANTLFFTPYLGVPTSVGVYNENRSAPWRIGDPQQPFPAYPAYPAKPAYRPTSAYVIYFNRMGDVS
ncbi:MAG: hypothetical protein ACRC9K_12140 [Afipia sp.]